ncbi:hypothetical protein CC86DRAFT_330497, partial [Ophiobolus disseminans]
MSSIHTKIQEAASQNASLLQGLHETDSAPSQLEQQNAYIKDLEHHIATTTKRVNDLKRSTAAELEDHEKYRDSTMRRFAHKATGQKEKFASKAAKEEKEYFDAIQAQKSAEDELTYTHHLKSTAEAHRAAIQPSADRHAHLQSQLNRLYASIFAGPTPAFPAEDAAEAACAAASSALGNLHQSLEQEKHTLFLLGQTAQKLSAARAALDAAYSMSQYDMFGGGTMASMQKRNYLERAESCVQQVRMLQDQLPPDVPRLGPLEIAVGSIWSDVVFDNVFSDGDMHEKIKASVAQVESAGNACGGVVREREGRLGGLLGVVGEAEERMERARADLQRVREEAFLSICGGQGVQGMG